MLQLDNYSCFLHLPKDYESTDKRYATVYLHADEQVYDFLVKEELLKDFPHIVVGILSPNRLHDYTPWPASSLHPKFPNFEGHGDSYLNWIKSRLKPYMDEHYRTLPDPKKSAMAGYSLGGLISLYCGMNHLEFGCIASLSGSFWYPDFVSYVAKHISQLEHHQIYLSSGKMEGVGHKDIKKEAVSCTETIAGLLSDLLSDSSLTLSWDDGGHHDFKKERYQNALHWLSKTLAD